MKIPFKAKLRRSGNAWVMTIPAAYVENGLLKKGDQYSAIINAVHEYFTPNQATGFDSYLNYLRVPN